MADICIHYRGGHHIEARAMSNNSTHWVDFKSGNDLITFFMASAEAAHAYAAAINRATEGLKLLEQPAEITKPRLEVVS
jgi:hypothetical protein